MYQYIEHRPSEPPWIERQLSLRGAIRYCWIASISEAADGQLQSLRILSSKD
jgi:hypothetical protein